MKSKAEVIHLIKSGKLQSTAIDIRDFSRLADFFESAELPILGFEAQANWQAKPWTKQNITQQLTEDLRFAVQKARLKRSNSVLLMASCVRLWLLILEDDLYDFAPRDLYLRDFWAVVQKKYRVRIGKNHGQND